jgi:hypothetical protein
MAFEDRLIALCEQAPPVVTGIDFIQIVQPHVQTVLRVFFIINPDQLFVPMVATAAMPAPFPPAQVEIVSTTGGDLPLRVTVTAATWRIVPTPAGDRTVLEIDTATAGGFTFYRLTIHDPPLNRVDRFFNGVVFSFKQGCPSVFDCRTTRDCPPEARVDFPIDYLARDFESLRNALLDFSGQRYPLWRERIPADAGAMVMELVAALGDEFAYIQDRIAREGALETLAERRSMRRHATLVDYTIDDGESATTWIDIQVAPGVQTSVPAGTRVWATPEGEAPMPYELGLGLADQIAGVSYWITSAWNAIQVHVPDPANPCLLAGATELYLVGEFPLPAALPPGAVPGTFWLGRPMLIQSDPQDPAEPSRRFPVHITQVEVTHDPLVLNAGVPLTITRIAWDPKEALAFDLCLRDATVHGNLVAATAGETFTEFLAIADKSTVAPADFDRVEVAVERQGPLNENDGTRPAIFLKSLTQTETRGLGRLSDKPEVDLQEVQPSLAPTVPVHRWNWLPSLIAAQGDDSNFTLDDGTWRKVITFDRPSGRYEHVDRASAAGMTIRFGDDEFGRTPADGTLFQVRYRTDVGTRANLPPESVNVIDDPFNPGGPSPWPTLSGIATSITNPFAIVSGRDPQDLAAIKQFAPEAFKALPLRAVRDEDYREIAERLDWVQRAGATARWTGSWLTEFVTVDPRGTVELNADHRAELELEMDCVRQAGRPVVVRNPVYRPIDLRIRICVKPDAYEGQVLERVTFALAGRRRPGKPIPFFDPDDFTFGSPLYRAALEAAIQAVPGVLGVEDIRIRVRGLFDWQDFAGFVFRPGDDRIIRLDNDPARPEAGSLIVTTRSLA